MKAIQLHLPNPHHVENHRIFVKAPPAEAWEKARHFDAATIPWVKLLFTVRSWPSQLQGHHLEEKDRRVGVDQIAENGKGFMILQEKPGREVVIGAIGQFWHLTIPFASFSPDTFSAFQEPGWGKLAWAISVEPFAGGSTISFELRTTATDEESWTRLNRYYHVIGLFSRLIRESVMAHLEAELGKLPLPDDDERSLPGDEILSEAKYGLTHSTIIEASPALVWRYLMQLGCDRAGWYSIDLLDHGGKPSIDRLVAGWEKRSVGEHLAATPAQDHFFEVYLVEPERAFVIGGEQERMGGPFRMTWAFVLEPVGEEATHLVVRARLQASPPLAEWLMAHVLYPPIHGLMQGAQLRNLKRICERDAQLQQAEPQTG
jgi:hypothetical protein